MSKHTKAANRDDPNSCWNKAADTEPIFVLRAHDPLAAYVVRYWVTLRVKERGLCDKVLEANACQLEMQQWLAERQLEGKEDLRVESNPG